MLDKSGLACCFYCTKSGWCYVGHFRPALAYNLHSPPASGKQGLRPEEMSQTLQENLDEIHAPNIISQCKLALTTRNRYLHCLHYKIIGAPKKFKK